LPATRLLFRDEVMPLGDAFLVALVSLNQARQCRSGVMTFSASAARALVWAIAVPGACAAATVSVPRGSSEHKDAARHLPLMGDARDSTNLAHQMILSPSLKLSPAANKPNAQKCSSKSVQFGSMLEYRQAEPLQRATPHASDRFGVNLRRRRLSEVADRVLRGDPGR